jgi:4-amino-4-deoxy-L-arabinose transferase-like glycosyltransferase
MLSSPRRDLLAIFCLALVVRGLFAIAIGDTYDYDEFVVLLLARDFSTGAVPYHSFMFFHPPGILVILRGLQPVLQHWWQAARLLSVLADSSTAAAVYSISRTLYDRRGAAAAGIVYVFSPVALVSSARAGQDPLITFLGVAGLLALLRFPGISGGLVAGICLGLALWIKYPALYFLPVYVLASPRRSPYVIPVAAAVALAGVAPFLGHPHAFLFQTVTFQRTRWIMQTDVRVETTVLYWLVVNVLAVVAVLRRRFPAWLYAGFLLGGLFVLTSQVYYHYFVPVAPFAALLAARLVADRFRLLLAAGAILCLAWAALIDVGGPSPLYVTAAHLSAIRPTVALLDARTRPSEPVLADRLEYAYLAHRPALADYFWNIGVLVRAGYLERRVRRAGAVVLSYGASSGYPRGFLTYLDARYPRNRTRANTVWLVPHG